MTTQRARSLRSNPTDAEQRLWSRLRMRQVRGCRIRRQRPIGPYVVDFVCLERRLIVEVDGGQHAQRAQRDADRDGYLASLGFKVIRFWNNQVLAETDAVVEAVAQSLEHCGYSLPNYASNREKDTARLDLDDGGAQ